MKEKCDFCLKNEDVSHWTYGHLFTYADDEDSRRICIKCARGESDINISQGIKQERSRNENRT